MLLKLKQTFAHNDFIKRSGTRVQKLLDLLMANEDYYASQAELSKNTHCWTFEIHVFVKEL